MSPQSSVRDIVYYPEVDIVSYRYGNSGNYGVTTSRLFYTLFMVNARDCNTMIFGSKTQAHNYALRNVR